MVIRSRYSVVERLGSGAMGTVYAVDDLVDGARVALKALWPGAGDGELAASLRSEFGVLAALRHPLLCRVHDFGRLPAGLALPGAPDGAAERGGLFYTRELVAGVDLGAAAAAAAHAVAPVCRWLAAAARGLDVLHRAGLRHGDFKPRNAIVDDGDRPTTSGRSSRQIPTVDLPGVRLIDFGLAAGETSIRSAGTLAYMAPEVLARRRVDRRADLYALGVALFELVSGALPSGTRGPAELAAWHLQRERPALPARRGVPPALGELAARLIAFDPDDRLPSAAEAAAALDAIAEASTSRRHKSTRRSGDGENAHSVSSPDLPVSLFFPPVGQAHVAALERAFERRRAGQGGPALIELSGAVGCGKSTILTELAWRAQLAGAEVLRGQPEARGHALGALGAAL
ncbi:MAG TPA: serine/threonine-protein kinase, partial [Kofleriaceae bacterium]|nr:serine/threonine-protein kinase [Kofleriaceae bacterium]